MWACPDGPFCLQKTTKTVFSTLYTLYSKSVMAAGCPHVKNLQLASDKSFLNPRTWACVDCGFTDTVWACLLCSNVACGRSNSKHALNHFKQTKHPIAVEVNHGYIHCYLCNDYVLTDNSSGDIALVQSLLKQVASQSYSESCSRSGHVIRPVQNRFTRSESRVEAASDRAADKRYTALCHWRFSQLARAFNTWRSYVASSKAPPTATDAAPPTCRRSGRKKMLTPGMTGLRNLGNTCYMNAVLQSLSHLALFRECFKQFLPQSHTHPQDMAPPQVPNLRQVYTRQTTVECFQHITMVTPNLTRKNTRQRNRCRGVGLSGGRGGRPRSRIPSTDHDDTQCMSAEMHALMRVLWSGKWAVVTPHAVLDAVWTLIPSFHGYTQQDAQEFLCELLLVLQNELDQWVPSCSIPLPVSPHSLLPSLFEGQLLSKVTCSGCGHSSSIEEPFWDLSLDFPEKYQGSSKDCSSSSLTLQDMLDRFIKPEELEGKMYKCEKCSNGGSLQDAKKQLLIADPPDVLRFHLKRFHWSGRDRHKINSHVSFPLSVDIRPYCISKTQPFSVTQPSSAAASIPTSGARTLPSAISQPFASKPNTSDVPSTPKVSFDLTPSTFTYPPQEFQFSNPHSLNSKIQPSSLAVQVPVAPPDTKLSLSHQNHAPQQPLPNCNQPSPGKSESDSITCEKRTSSSVPCAVVDTGCVGDGRHGCASGECEQKEGMLYRLSSVVVHHGTGFQSGHYTAYCWNNEAESWVHCNDTRIIRCTTAELQACQAYILFYSRSKDGCDSSWSEEPCPKRRRLD